MGFGPFGNGRFRTFTNWLFLENFNIIFMKKNKELLKKFNIIIFFYKMFNPLIFS